MRRRLVRTVLVVALCLVPAAVPATAQPKVHRFAPGAPGIGDPCYPLDGNGGYGRTVTTAQFVAPAEKVSGQDLDAFFTTWLFTPSTPPGIEPPAPPVVDLAAKRFGDRLRRG